MARLRCYKTTGIDYFFVGPNRSKYCDFHVQVLNEMLAACFPADPNYVAPLQPLGCTDFWYEGPETFDQLDGERIYTITVADDSQRLNPNDTQCMGATKPPVFDDLARMAALFAARGEPSDLDERSYTLSCLQQVSSDPNAEPYQWSTIPATLDGVADGYERCVNYAEVLNAAITAYLNGDTNVCDTTTSTSPTSTATTTVTSTVTTSTSPSSTATSTATSTASTTATSTATTSTSPTSTATTSASSTATSTATTLFPYGQFFCAEALPAGDANYVGHGDDELCPRDVSALGTLLDTCGGGLPLLCQAQTPTSGPYLGTSLTAKACEAQVSVLNRALEAFHVETIGGIPEFERFTCTQQFVMTQTTFGLATFLVIGDKSAVGCNDTTDLLNNMIYAVIQGEFDDCTGPTGPTASATTTATSTATSTGTSGTIGRLGCFEVGTDAFEDPDSDAHVEIIVFDTMRDCTRSLGLLNGLIEECKSATTETPAELQCVAVMYDGVMRYFATVAAGAVDGCGVAAEVLNRVPGSDEEFNTFSCSVISLASVDTSGDIPETTWFNGPALQYTETQDGSCAATTAAVNTAISSYFAETYVVDGCKLDGGQTLGANPFDSENRGGSGRGASESATLAGWALLACVAVAAVAIVVKLRRGGARKQISAASSSSGISTMAPAAVGARHRQLSALSSSLGDAWELDRLDQHVHNTAVSGGADSPHVGLGREADGVWQQFGGAGGVEEQILL